MIFIIPLHEVGITEQEVFSTRINRIGKINL